jgi:hypothetical protein
MYIKDNYKWIFIFVFMACSVFTFSSIAEHYFGVPYSFNEIVGISIWTAFGTTVFFYWWGDSESEEENGTQKEMPGPESGRF